jgi:toxin ParE1/3/4
MARVTRTTLARKSLKDIGRYIASESGSRDIALRFLDSIEEKCRVYATQPLMGTARTDLGENVRCFPVGNYVVLYRPLDDGIELLLVVHGARDIPALYRRLFGRRDRADD